MDGGACVEIGKVVGAHGIRGAVRVVSFSENPDLFAPGAVLRLVCGGGAAREYTVAGSTPHKNIWRLGLSGVETREAAEALAGCSVQVPRDRLPEPGPGEYYWIDLLGMTVVTAEGELLGRLSEIIPTGANDVYSVLDETTGRETLVPALDWVIQRVDLEARTMVVVLPEGL